MTAIFRAVFEEIRGAFNVKDMHEHQGRFTQSFVQAAREKYPEWNVLITCQQTDRHFVDEIHQHEELDLGIFGTRGYEIFFCKSGDFTRFGDGGFENWCFNGNYVRDGDHVTFFPIQGMLPRSYRS